ncbi:MAG TPA: hypothetical protein VNH42_05655 [Mariprofundaceae bacterium]|nr:hypothetical protein [Mariprofundaceae bacterium]
MPQINEISVSRHAAQAMMHAALTMAPQSCVGLLAGHGHGIDEAMPLLPGPETQDPAWKPQAADIRDAADRLRQHGMGILGWFHSRLDSHEPDEDTMRWLEQLSGSVPGFDPGASPIHLLVALDTKGRLDLHAYVLNHAERMAPMPLRLLDDSPLYLASARR